MADIAALNVVINSKGARVGGQQVSKAIKEISRDSEKLTKKIKRMSSETSKGFKKMSHDMIGITTGFRAVGAAAAVAAVGFGALNIIKVGAEFEQTMIKVGGISGTIIDGQVTPAFKALNDIAREMGETTEWSANQAAKALEFMSMAGMAADESITALPGVLDLATAGMLDLGRAADIATNVMKTFRLEADDMTRVNDVMIKTITTSNTNIESLAESMKYGGIIAAGFNYTIEETASLVGILGNSGLQGSLAGTQLAFAIQKADGVFQKYNKTMIDSEGNSKKLIDAIELMEVNMTSTDDVMQIFGARGGRAVLSFLSLGSEAMREYTKVVKDNEGVSKRIAELQRTTVIGAFKELKSVIESIKIDAFNAESGDLNNGIREITATLRENREGFVDFGTLLVEIADKVIWFTAKVGGAAGYFFNFSKAIALAHEGTVEWSQALLDSSNVVQDFNNKNKNFYTQLKENSLQAKLELENYVNYRDKMISKIEKEGPEVWGVLTDESSKYYKFVTQSDQDLLRLRAKLNAQSKLAAAFAKKGYGDSSDLKDKNDALQAQIAHNKELLKLGGQNAALAEQIYNIEGGGTGATQQKIQFIKNEIEGKAIVLENQIKLLQSNKEITEFDQKKIALLQEQMSLNEKLGQSKINDLNKEKEIVQLITKGWMDAYAEQEALDDSLKSHAGIDEWLKAQETMVADTDSKNKDINKLREQALSYHLELDQKRIDSANEIDKIIEQHSVDASTREINALNDSFENIRIFLGNTKQVHAAYNLALEEIVKRRNANEIKTEQEKVGILAEISTSFTDRLEYEKEYERMALDKKYDMYAKHVEDKAELNEWYNRQVKKIDDADLKGKLGVYREMAGGLSDAFSDMASMGGKYTRQAFRMHQASAVAQAIISGHLAVLNALKIDPPMGQIMAGVMVASTAARVAAIASQPVPQYGDGGISYGPEMALVGEKGPEAHVPLKGGSIPVVIDRSDEKSDMNVSIANISTPEQYEQWAASNRGVNTIMNVLSANSHRVKKALR